MDYWLMGLVFAPLFALAWLFVNHLRVNRARRIKEVQEAAREAEWQRLRDRVELRQRSREELRAAMGGSFGGGPHKYNYNAGGSGASGTLSPPWVISTANVPPPVQDMMNTYYFNGGSDIGSDGPSIAAEPINSGGGTFDGAGASGDWSSPSSAPDSCSSSSDSSSSSSDSGSCSSGSD